MIRILSTRQIVGGLAVAVTIANAWPSAAAAILSAKRGFADTGANYNNLQATGAGWYYTWGVGGNSGGFDAKLAPMFWGGWAVNQENINAVKNNANVEWVLGFNEPERTDQANMSVAQAISSWTTLSNGFAGSGKKLVSPAVSDTSAGKAWMSDFMTQANSAGLTVDAVAFHWYGWSSPDNVAQAAANFMGSLNWYHQWNKPVFVTEFAIHDWGGAYTDDQIKEANRQFLDIVIPQLEATSWVAGYAWYHWFSDAPLYEGNPPKPTALGETYVGALKSGTVEDIGGRNLGEHVAYLAGGELTVTGSAPTNFNYINALSNTSRVSGAVNWGLTTGDWVRIQPGATLRKTGGNTVTFGSPVDNRGALEVAAGTLVVGSSVNGAGSVRIEGGTLALTFRGLLNTASSIDVQSGGTFDVTGRQGIYTVQNGQTLNVGSSAMVLGDVTVAAGATVAGAGSFTGNFTAQSGSLVRIGGNGFPTSKIDDFETYTPGALSAGATGGVWKGVFDGTANARVVNSGGNNSLEFYGTGSSWRGAQTSLKSAYAPTNFALADGEEATYFFRVQRQGTQTIDGIFGLTNLEGIGIDQPWNELAITMSLFQGTGGGSTTALRALDNEPGGGDITVLNNIAANEWINVWLVVDNQAKTFQVATSTGDSTGTLFPRVFNFGRQLATGETLDTFAAAEFRSPSNPANAGVRIDDLYYLAGVDLTNPLVAPPSVLGETMTVTGDVVLESGMQLAFDVYDPTRSDRLVVTGNFTAGGTLRVALDAGAPPLGLGETFDLIDFATAGGAFADYDLPGLPIGMAWNVSELLMSGTLSVVADVDLDDDGDVDGRDLLLIQRSDAALVASWQTLYGAQIVVPTSASEALAVPEPRGVWLIICGLALHLRRAIIGTRG